MKIYLSKSNLCDPVITSAVRKVIENNDHELVEFRGGTYDIANVLSCDMVIVVTSPNAGDNVNENMRKLGRGVYSEIKNSLEKNIPVNIVLAESNGALYVCDIVKVELFNTNDWKTEYGILTHNSVGVDLQTILNRNEEEILLTSN